MLGLYVFGYAVLADSDGFPLSARFLVGIWGVGLIFRPGSAIVVPLGYGLIVAIPIVTILALWWLLFSIFGSGLMFGVLAGVLTAPCAWLGFVLISKLLGSRAFLAVSRLAAVLDGLWRRE